MANPTGKHDACPECRLMGHDRSGDNRVWYDDGSWHCFARGHTSKRITEQEDMMGALSLEDVARLPSRALKERGISDDVARTFGVKVEVDTETGADGQYYFPLYTNAGLTGYQKKAARAPGKRQKNDVSRVGETKGSLPFGAHAKGGNRMCVVTEGGEDCLAAFQMLKSKGKMWRVVATMGVDGWKNKLEYFHQFEKIVIAYDQDDAGKQAAVQFAEALPSGKAVIMRWGGKVDPNALHLLGEKGADMFLQSLYNAKPHQPDGVVYGEEVWDRMKSFVEPASIPYPEEWVELNAKVKGLREAEITMFTGGSSAGKTAYMRHIKHHIIKNTDWKIGEVELEERGEKTWRGVMEAELQQDWAKATPEARRQAYENTYGTNRIFTLDHRSQYGKGQSLVGKFKHLHHAMGCKALFLDHVTLAVNEFGDGQGNQAQDHMMNEFLELVEATGVHLFLISHLRKTGVGGKSFEEGAVPTMDDLKGSGSLKQISFNIIGVSRNLQHEDEYSRNVSQLHVLKCRETGKTGRADRLYWDDPSRSLVPAREEQPDTKQDDDQPRGF